MERREEELGKLCPPDADPAESAQKTLQWETKDFTLVFSLFQGPVQDPGPLPRLVSSVFLCQVL